MPQLDGKQIKDAPDGVATAKINDLAVTEAKIATSAVTNGKIADDAVDENKLNATVAGNGLTGADGSPLAVGNAGASGISVSADAVAVNVDGTTLEVSGTGPGVTQVKALGIDTAQLADDAVTNAKIGPLAVDTTELQANAVTPAKADLTTPWSFTADNLQVTTTPDSDNDAANKGYVDSVAQGLHVKAACRLATAAALPAYTPAGSGVGKTITINATGDLNVDGVKVLLDDRVLVKDEGASHVDHGIYECTTEGGVGVSAVLTRATDFDTDAEVVAGAFTFIEEGSTQADTGWVVSTDNPITVDTTAIAFTQFSGAGTYTAGQGLDLSGTQFLVQELANSGIDVLSTGSAVNVDDATIEIAAGTPGTVQVKDLGITTAKINTDAVTAAKLNADTAGAGLVPNGGTGALDVNPGNGIQVTGDTVAIKPDPTAGPSVAADGTGLRAAVPYISDKYQAPNNCTTDDASTGIALTQTPANPSYIQVMVNGVEAEVGDGVATKECYFATAAAPTTPLAISAVAATDLLIWNAVIAKYNLSAAKDLVALHYAYAS